jgi:putative permease
MAASRDPAPAVRVRASWVGFVAAAAAAVAMLWFVERVLTALLLLFLVVVVSMALSVPVGFLRRKGVPKRLAAAIVLLLFVAALVLVGWLVIPRVIEQLVVLIERLPQLIVQLNARVLELLARNPELQELVASRGAPDFSPAALGLFAGVGNFSLGLLGGLALTIIFMSGVISVVSNPRPVLKAYIASLPRRHRHDGVRAYRQAQRAIAGWTVATVLVGSIEFILVFTVLTLLDVPGALVWAALAFFVEFIPRIGNYLMAIPPVLVALSISPMTAVYVALFYFAMGELMGAFVVPRIGGAAMAIHPLLLLFFALAFALAFGLLGALVATPAAAFFAAFYSAFYLKRGRSRSV